VNITDGPSHQITSGLCHYAAGHMLILEREAWVGTMVVRERESARERETEREGRQTRAVPPLPATTTAPPPTTHHRTACPTEHPPHTRRNA
jgi:hypothetical protein